MTEDGKQIQASVCSRMLTYAYADVCVCSRMQARRRWQRTGSRYKARLSGWRLRLSSKRMLTYAHVCWCSRMLTHASGWHLRLSSKRMLAYADVCICWHMGMLTNADVCWQIAPEVIKQAYADVCWRMLTYAHMLTYADVCWRMLTYAELTQVIKQEAYGRKANVCWRMLTYADVCWHMLTYAGDQAGGLRPQGWYLVGYISKAWVKHEQSMSKAWAKHEQSMQ
jgi:hypothetical protein